MLKWISGNVLSSLLQILNQRFWTHSAIAASSSVALTSDPTEVVELAVLLESENTESLELELELSEPLDIIACIKRFRK